MNKIKVIGYYTKNTLYETQAKNLIKSLNDLQLDHDIEGVVSTGTWQGNTRLKAKFIKRMLNKHPDYSILYVDADAIVRSEPELLYNLNCDVAVRWENFTWRPNECLSGTIYMANNDKTKSLCDLWDSINKSNNNKKNLEQWNLGSAIDKMKDLKTFNLPPEYTFIFDLSRRLYKDAVPVIEHFQASRKVNKNKI